MRVVLAVKSVLPSHGGPAFSVSNLARALADAGIDVGLWASDMSAATTPLLTASTRLQPITGPPVRAFDRFGWPDVLHDNGIWLSHNHHLAELACRRRLLRVISTRGMLEPWAMSHKKLKKRLAWWLYQRRDLSSAAYHHATAAAEAENVERLKLGVPIGVIPNGIDVVERRPRTGKDVRTALYLGRIHPVKGLPLLIEAWSRLRPQGWELQIAGPDEKGYRGEIERMVYAASLSEAVHFLGPLEGEAKEQAFAGADFVVLPSLSESFGMAIGEAFAHGVPVLTTTSAPWPMIAQRECGWRVSATIEGIMEGLGEATALDPAVLAKMGERGQALVRQDFAWSNIAQQFIATYERLLSQKGPRLITS